jgi:hypothetical protein
VATEAASVQLTAGGPIAGPAGGSTIRRGGGIGRAPGGTSAAIEITVVGAGVGRGMGAGSSVIRLAPIAPT